jgi:hypothetical protein
MTVHHTELQAPEVEELSRLDHDGLLQKRKSLDEAEDALGDEIQEYLKSHEDEAAVLEKIDDNFWASPESSRETDVREHILSLDDGTLSESLRAMLRKSLLASREHEKVEQELTRRYGKELHEFAQQEAEKLLNYVDNVEVQRLWKSDAKLPDNDGLEPDQFTGGITAAITIVDHLVGIVDGQYNSGNDYSIAEAEYDAVERGRDVLERWGVLREKPVDKMADVPTATEEQLRAVVLNRAYRPYHNEVPAYMAPMKSFLPMHEWAVHLDDVERSALDRHLQSIDVKKEVERLAIRGIELLPFHYDEAELREHLLRIPGIAFEGVREIVFKKKTEEEHTQDSKLEKWDGKSVVETGHHYHDLRQNSAEIVIWVDQPEQIYDFRRDQHGDDVAKRFAIIEMEETIDHEFGHALHTKLPVHLLDEWEASAQAFDVDVSEYVRQKHGSNDTHYKMENFADTFALYINDPTQLDKKHFDAMNNIYRRTTPVKPAAVDPDDWWGVKK